jgi:hypothetical protein
MSHPIPKPDWKEFRDALVATIKSYRIWRERLSICGTEKALHAYGTCRESVDQYYCMIKGHTMVLSRLWPNDPRIQRLTGFILFAGESAENEAIFFENIDKEIEDLINERL